MLKKVKLNEICSPSKGKQIDTSLLNENLKYKYINGGIRESGYYDSYNTNGNTVIISEGGASCGYVSYVEEPFWCGCHCYRLEKPKVNIKYLFYALKYNQNNIMNMRLGAAMPNIKKSSLCNMNLNIDFDSDAQLHVVDVLNRIEKLIENRKKTIELLDEIIKSRFNEMFCDKNFKKIMWNDLFNTKTGKLDSNAMVANGQYPFFTCAKEVYAIDKYAFDQEALLLAGNNAAGKYDVKYYKGKFNAYQRTYVLSLKNENWSYKLFKEQLESKLEYLREQSKGCNTRYITLKILSELEFILPPIELQNEFENFVNLIDKSKLNITNEINKLKELFNKKMFEFFDNGGEV